MSHAVQGRKEHCVCGYVGTRRRIRIFCPIGKPVGVIVLVKVEVVDVGLPKINMRVVMKPLGKVVVHHRAKGR